MRALDYHESTKHSWERVRANPHSLDFANMPLPFKIYTDLARQPLSTDLPDSAVPALAALAEPGVHAGGDRVPGRNELARLLSAVGITKRRRYPGGEMLFRGAPCTGALYHIEVYVICADLKDLPAGVYQFQPKDSSVCLLRPGDCRQVLIDASGAHAAVADAPVVLVLTSTWWRNAWKYQARAYRHAWWDSGCMAANLLAQAAALELPASLVAGYADEPVNRLLDIDPENEASLMLVPIGRGGPAQAAPPPRLALLGLSTEPLSHHEVAYPDIPAVHAASCLNTGAEAAAWRGAHGRRHRSLSRAARPPATSGGRCGSGRAAGGRDPASRINPPVHRQKHLLHRTLDNPGPDRPRHCRGLSAPLRSVPLRPLSDRQRRRRAPRGNLRIQGPRTAGSSRSARERSGRKRQPWHWGRTWRARPASTSTSSPTCSV